MRTRLAAAAAVVLFVLVARPVITGTGVAAAASTWTGKVDLYRSGTFTTQQSWLWCTAADVQIMRNIVDGATDHSAANQRRYFRYMRARNRYDIPVSDGVDPAGWAAGLRQYVDERYELTTSTSFDAALRASVTNLRRTNLPVGITVAHGNHAWILTGFSATADPAATKDFTVTSVRVVGPLWGLQNRSYGYDMRPATKLSTRQFKGFFTPWHYAGVRMAWEGRWVSMQPVPAAAVDRTAAPTSATTPTPTHSPTASAAASREPRTTASAGDVAIAAPPGAVGTDAGLTVSEPAGTVTTDGSPAAWVSLGAALPVVLVVIVSIVAMTAWAQRRR